MGKRLVWLSAGVVLLSAVDLVQAQRGAAPGAVPAVPTASATQKGVKDADLEKAIRQAVDFLFRQKKDKAVNFEGTAISEPVTRLLETPPPAGAQTALAVYALLTARQSIDDPRLKPDSKELKPVIDWLTKLEPNATFTAAMQIQALALLPQPRAKTVDAAMLRARDFLDTTTGVDGGHGQGWARSFDNRDLEMAWDEYIDAKYPKEQGPDAQALFDDAKTRLNDVIRHTRLELGGTQPELKRLLQIVRDRDPKSAARPINMNRELAELDAYVREAANIAAPMSTPQDVNQLRQLKASLAKLDTEPGSPLAVRVAEKINMVDRMLASAEFEVQMRSQPQGDIIDSHYAAGAYAALVTCGLDLRQNTWRLDDSFWRMTQLTGGAWGYWPDGELLTKPQINSTGVAGLVSMLSAADASEIDLKTDKVVDKAMAWLDGAFAPQSTDLPGLCDVERIGMLTGRRQFDRTPWFAAAAQQMVRMQQSDGSLNGSFVYSSPTTATAFGLLFLARGRGPLVFNKLEYKGTWNSRPRDGLNVATWVGKKLDRAINWQSVKLDDPAEAFNEAPILMITGAHDPKFTADEIEKLKAFVQAGGMIVSSADANSTEFAGAMKKAASEVVDGPYDWKEVDEKSELLTAFAPLKRAARVSALSNGVRTLWVQSENDWGTAWQKRAGVPTDYYDAMTNIYAYATSQLARSRLETRVVENAPAVPALPARSITVARIEYAGNWNPEPGAWARFAEIAKAQFNTKLELKTVDMAALDAKTTPIAHLTGTGKVMFAPDAVAAVNRYVAAGGILIVDAAGGDADFATVARALIKGASARGEVLGDIQSSDPIYAAELPPAPDAKKGVPIAGAKKIDAVEYRPYLLKKEGKPTTTPRLQSVVADGRTKVVYSAEDITSGFLGTNTWGIKGYSPESSVALMRNILLAVTAK